MCHPTCIQFAAKHLAAEEVRGRDVLEVGARDVNGSVRPTVESLGPARYLGVDIVHGVGVDELCPVEELVDRFGPDSFDVVISTELLEHVRDWRLAVSNLKTVLKPGGSLLVTARSRGFALHGWPYDFWRFEPDDARAIFADLDVEAVATDDIKPGVFVKARKPAGWRPPDLGDYELYSVATKRRVKDISRAAELSFKVRFRAPRLVWRALPESARVPLRRVRASLRP